MIPARKWWKLFFEHHKYLTDINIRYSVLDTIWIRIFILALHLLRYELCIRSNIQLMEMRPAVTPVTKSEILDLTKTGTQATNKIIITMLCTQNPKQEFRVFYYVSFTIQKNMQHPNQRTCNIRQHCLFQFNSFLFNSVYYTLKCNFFIYNNIICMHKKIHQLAKVCKKTFFSRCVPVAVQSHY